MFRCVLPVASLYSDVIDRGIQNYRCLAVLQLASHQVVK
jgi:hypothetical protein